MGNFIQASMGITKKLGKMRVKDSIFSLDLAQRIRILMAKLVTMIIFMLVKDSYSPLLDNFNLRLY